MFTQNKAADVTAGPCIPHSENNRPSLTYNIFFVFIGLHLSTFFSLTVMLLLALD